MKKIYSLFLVLSVILSMGYSKNFLSERFFEMEFVDKCAKEIETILNPMEPSPDETMGEEEKEEEKEED